MANNIFANAGDEFVDDFTTTVVMRNIKNAFDPIKKKLNSDNPSAFDEALASALTTFEFGLQMYLINYVTSNIIPSMIKRSTAIYTYVLVGKAGNGIANKIKSAKFKTGLKKGLLGALLDTTEHRYSKAKLANDMVSHLDSTALKNKQIMSARHSNLESSMLKANSSMNRPTAIFTYKTSTGTWNATQEDKKTYELATGQKVTVSWAKLSRELNKYKDFAIDIQGNVINEAQVRFDDFVSSGRLKP